MSVDVIVPRVAERLARARPEAMLQPCVYRFNLTGAGGGSFHIIVASGYARVSPGAPPGGATCTISLAVADAVDLVELRLNPLLAYFSGRIKIAGDVTAAARLGQLLR